MHTLLIEYERLYEESYKAKQHASKAKSLYLAALVEQRTAERKLETARDALDRVLDQALGAKEGFYRQLHTLCKSIPTPKQAGKGRPKTPLADVVFACVLKVYSGISGRRATSELKRCEELGLMDKAPHYNSISDALNSPDLTPLLRKLVQESTPLENASFSLLPSDSAVDSMQLRSKKETAQVNEQLCNLLCRNISALVSFSPEEKSESNKPTLKEEEEEEEEGRQEESDGAADETVAAERATPQMKFAMNSEEGPVIGVNICLVADGEGVFLRFVRRTGEEPTETEEYPLGGSVDHGFTFGRWQIGKRTGSAERVWRTISTPTAAALIAAHAAFRSPSIL